MIAAVLLALQTLQTMTAAIPQVRETIAEIRVHGNATLSDEAVLKLAGIAIQDQRLLIEDPFDLGHRELNRRVASEALTGVGRTFLTCGLDKRIQRPLQGSKRCGGHRAIENLCKWNAVQGSRMVRVSRALQVEHVELAQGAMLRNERILHHDIVAARRTQSHDIPVRNDAVVGARQQEVAGLSSATLPISLCRYHRAEDDPFAVA